MRARHIVTLGDLRRHRFGGSGVRGMRDGHLRNVQRHEHVRGRRGKRRDVRRPQHHGRRARRHDDGRWGQGRPERRRKHGGGGVRGADDARLQRDVCGPDAARALRDVQQRLLGARLGGRSGDVHEWELHGGLRGRQLDAAQLQRCVRGSDDARTLRGLHEDVQWPSVHPRHTEVLDRRWLRTGCWGRRGALRDHLQPGVSLLRR